MRALSREEPFVNWKKYGYVIASTYRQKVVLALRESERTPKQIAERTRLHPSHVSHVLADLLERELAICLTPNLRRGRIYALTQEGKEIAAKLEEERR